ncbi:DNA-binding protein [Microlunatus soli]|uniref:DNA-binding protein n=1 Tax=Microlunatus soli TaxID=630515 RepID=A0A1H1ZXD7_9ACTN|nr:DNA-binding protein [Microlunatus soli]SDT38227.1 hypothetical protein SAMN04489812_5514 [Microlunatus soli]
MPPITDPFGSADDDQVRAHREQLARARLLDRPGVDGITARPGRPAAIPPSAVDLVQDAVHRSADLAEEDLLSALVLLPAARAEVDGLESGLLFLARSAGLTWAQIAEAMGFNSPQACQQHYDRLAARRNVSR